MQQVTVTDRAAKAIEYIRKEHDYLSSNMCIAMTTVINQISDRVTGTIIPFDEFYPLVVLAELQELRNELEITEDDKPQKAE